MKCMFRWTKQSLSNKMIVSYAKTNIFFIQNNLDFDIVLTDIVNQMDSFIHLID